MCTALSICVYILTCIMDRNRFMSSFSGGNPHATSKNNANSLIESFPLSQLVIRVCGRAFSGGVRVRSPINHRRSIVSSLSARLSLPLPALSHWEVEVGGTSMGEMRGAGFAGSWPPFLGRLMPLCPDYLPRGVAPRKLPPRAFSVIPFLDVMFLDRCHQTVRGFPRCSAACASKPWAVRRMPRP